MVETTTTSPVADFVARAKQFISRSEFKDAVTIADSEYEQIMSSEVAVQLREEVTLLHWWTKCYTQAHDLSNMTGKCLTKVNAAIEKIEQNSATTFYASDGQTALSQLQIDECLAELLYIKRCIDTTANYVEAEESLKRIESLKNKAGAGQADNLLINKYYVKALLRHDEFQLGVETKAGYQQLLLAQRIDQDILTKKHGHKKETIRIQLNKMSKYKQFMDKANFDDLTKKAMQTHMRKPEVVQILRAVATKHSDLSEHTEAIRRIERAETLAGQLLPTKDHAQTLLVLTAKVEILLKKLRLGTEEEYEQVIAIAKSAMDMAKRIYGDVC